MNPDRMMRPPKPRLSGDGWGSGELEEASTTAALVAAQELQAVSNRPSTSYGWPFAASTEDDTPIPALRPDLYPEVLGFVLLGSGDSGATGRCRWRLTPGACSTR